MNTKSLVCISVRSFALLLFLAGARGYSQPFSFGVKAGVPVTDLVSLGPFSDVFTVTAGTTNRYVIGAFLEVRLPSHLAVESNLLYRHLNYQDQHLSVSPAGSGGVNERFTAGFLEIPFLLKYRFSRGTVRPYLDAGPTIGRLVGTSNSFVFTPAIPSISPVAGTDRNPAALRDQTKLGVAISGGCDVRLGFLHVSPELRYTHWTSQDLINSNQNQLELLFGLVW
jgi:hypothetical protein